MFSLKSVFCLRGLIHIHHYAKSCQTATPPLTVFAYLFTGVKVEETGKIGRKRWDDGSILSCTQIHIVVPLCFFSVPLLTFRPILGDASHLLEPELRLFLVTLWSIWNNFYYIRQGGHVFQFPVADFLPASVACGALCKWWKILL